MGAFLYMKPIEIFSSEVRQAVLDQNSVRTTWVEQDTPQHLEAFYWGEREEYDEAKELCMLGADPEKFVSEAGDLGYLYIKLHEATEGRVPRKIQFDVLQVYHECNQLGVDFIQAVFYKVLRNDIKYPITLSRIGLSYEESVRLSKEQYKVMGGDEFFGLAYMMLADQIQNR